MVPCIIVAGLVLPLSVNAWNDIGHKVVSRIAWDHMKPQTRSRVIALLKAAPQDSGILELLADDWRPVAVRERQFFMRASTWADIVRDRRFPRRREKYHKSSWHYINFFWDRPGPGSEPGDRVDMSPAPENVVERLRHFASSLVDERRRPSQRAIDLAWVLHLVGDIHQPLHCSARITAVEPQGDRGGNLFKLAEGENLHGYWDGILNKTFRWNRGESEDDYIGKIAYFIVKRHPRRVMQEQLEPGQFDAWAREGYRTAKQVVYPPSLRRHRTPSRGYRRKASRTAMAAIALAGYRLAEMLDQLFGSRSGARLGREAQSFAVGRRRGVLARRCRAGQPDHPRAWPSCGSRC